MAIMTGVRSAQVLGASTQKQADESRQALGQGSEEAFGTGELENVDFDAKANAQRAANEQPRGQSARGDDESTRRDGGCAREDTNNGLDVIR